MIDLDAVEADEARTPFDFRAEGRKWRVPHLADLPIGLQLLLDSKRVDQVLPEVALVFDDESGEWAFAPDAAWQMSIRMRPQKAGVLLTAWLAAAAVEPGESPASSS